MLENGQERRADYKLLRLDQPGRVFETLVEVGVCSADESIASVDKAGQGNMNLTLRVKTDRRSVIVKQSRPWVEKYPGIAAPDERIFSEMDFYRIVSDSHPVRSAMPSVLATDRSRRLLVLEDLGQASDYGALYGGEAGIEEVDDVFMMAIDWVTRLHRCPIDRNPSVGCKPLRSLNHQHIFSIPLLDPPATDLDLVCAGLTAESRSLCADQQVRQSMAKLGDLYLADDEGGVLLHGDYYPGSWLKTETGFRVIDPEFCFAGPREFDLGVLAAHWIFCGGTASEVVDRVCRHQAGDVGAALVEGFAGAEIIRRIVGVAQLPLTADLDQRRRWLECGVGFLKQSV